MTTSAGVSVDVDSLHRRIVDAGHALRGARRIHAGGHARERAEIVDRQRDVKTVLGDELPREAPADADVAEVVDDLAEDLPAGGHERA